MDIILISIINKRRYGMFKILLWWFGAGIWWLSGWIIRPRRLSCDRIYRMEVKAGRFNEELYKQTKKMEFTILSDYGYNLSCELLDGTGYINDRISTASGFDNRKSGGYRKQIPIAILCHGFCQSKYRSLIYAEIFLKMGFIVIIYDHRNHGLSGKAFTTMGFYEKFDLKKIVDWCYETFGPGCRIVTYGESMGAATVLLHLGIDDRVVCTIADCSYSNFNELLRHQFKLYYHFPRFLIPVESFVTYLRAGFWYKDVSPIDVVSKVDTPVLFIHGKKDNYVPAEMSRKMYACKKNNKALYLVAHAGHTKSCAMNRKAYEEKIERFIKKVFKHDFGSEELSCHMGIVPL